MPDIFDASNHDAPTADVDVSAPIGESPMSGTTSAEVEDTSSKLCRPVDEYSMVMRQETPSDNPFKSFLAKPEKIFFASQHQDEKVLLMLRQHPATQIKWIVVAVILAFMPLLFQSIGLLSFLPAHYQFASAVGWYLVLLGYVLEAFLMWFYNVYLITDERIVDVDFRNLLSKNISSAKLDRIEDISSEAGGIGASIFNYGTVKIQTAGSENEFEFAHVPQPAKVTAFLNEMLVEEEQEKYEERVN